MKKEVSGQREFKYAGESQNNFFFLPEMWQVMEKVIQSTGQGISLCRNQGKPDSKQMKRDSGLVPGG